MKIGVDISQVAYEGTGVARFTRGLVESICKYGTRHDWVFVFSALRGRLPDDLRDVITASGARLVTPPLPPTALSFLWNDLHVLPVTTFTGALDWFITSDWTEPPSKSKKATIVHDLTVYRYPETVDSKILSTQKKRLKRVSKESDLIIVDSDATRTDVAKYLDVKAPRVRRIYPGVESATVSRTQIQKTKKKLGIKKDFILTVGKLEPRKNLPRLLKAFEELAYHDIELLVVGHEGWGNKLSKVRNVRLMGYVDETDLQVLYRSCLFFIYPSLWEGFGYPVVEAMGQGAPVAASNTSSLYELANGYALTFNPTYTADIKRSMKLYLESVDLRREYSKKSRVRARDFTWNNYYNKLIKSLEEAS